MKKSATILVITILTITLLPLLVGRGPQAGPRVDGAPDEFYDVVIFGIDRRPHQKKGRSDVIIIVHCEPGRITLFSTPRDTLTRVRRRMDKINHAFAFGGVKLSIATIENLYKFKVDNYIVLDFETFLKTVDVISALTDGGRLIGAENFLASGENLLKWLRFRGLPTGDRRRCQRHQLFMKRVFEYTQDMYLEQPLLYGQCMKAGLKVVDSDLTYEHVAQLYETYKDIDVDEDIERYVLPGHGTSRYGKKPYMSRKRYERTYGPNFNAIIQKEGLTGAEAKKRKKQLRRKFQKEHKLVSYYMPKYNWSLMTYIRWFRKNNLAMNYKEVDTLRK